MTFLFHALLNQKMVRIPFLVCTKACSIRLFESYRAAKHPCLATSLA